MPKRLVLLCKHLVDSPKSKAGDFLQACLQSQNHTNRPKPTMNQSHSSLLWSIVLPTDTSTTNKAALGDLFLHQHEHTYWNKVYNFTESRIWKKIIRPLALQQLSISPVNDFLIDLFFQPSKHANVSGLQNGTIECLYLGSYYHNYNNINKMKTLTGETE